MQGRHFRHVPAANVLVARNRIQEHCAGPTRATRQHKAHHTNRRTRPRSEFKKGLRTDSQGEVSKASEDQRRAARERTWGRGPSSWAHDPCTCNPTGDRCKREKNLREKGGTYFESWSSRRIRPSGQCLGRMHPHHGTLRRSHTRHKATQNTPHQQKNEARSELKKCLRTDSQGEVSKANEDAVRHVKGLGPLAVVVAAR